MPIAPAERIRLITESARMLGLEPWERIDLTLSEFGATTSESWSGTREAYCIEHLRRSSDDALRGIHAYLVSDVDTGAHAGGGPWSGPGLRIFFSHLASEQKIAADVASALGSYGVDAFVAHDSIEPSLEWQRVIEGALTDCDALVAFFHEGFRESAWCDQEVGWALGRQRPILPLNYGVHAHGFVSKLQEQPAVGVNSYLVAQGIMAWLLRTPSLHTRLGKSLVEAFVTSRSWDFTRKVVGFLEQVAVIDGDDLTRMERAAVDNREITECNISGLSGPDWVRQYVAQRRGAGTDVPF